MEDLFKHLTTYLAIGVQGSAGVIIGLAAIEAFWKALRLFFGQRRASEELGNEIRLRFGRWLSLGLEFELAADILLTAIAPTWTEIGQLGAIVVLRTVLNFSLQIEIDKAIEKNQLD